MIIDGWRGPIHARKLIQDCRQAYLDAKAKAATARE